VSTYSWSQFSALSCATNFMFLKNLLVRSLFLCLCVFCSCLLIFWGLSELAWERRSRCFVATAHRQQTGSSIVVFFVWFLFYFWKILVTEQPNSVFSHSLNSTWRVFWRKNDCI
jgi:hypothetical protein